MQWRSAGGNVSDEIDELKRRSDTTKEQGCRERAEKEGLKDACTSLARSKKRGDESNGTNNPEGEKESSVAKTAV